MAAGAIGDARIDIGRVIQRGFETIGRNAFAFVLLALVLGALPGVVIPYLLLGNVIGGTPVPAVVRLGLPFFAMMVTGNIFQATVIRASILDLGGGDPEFDTALIEAVQLVPPMMAIFFLSTCLVVIGVMLAIIPGFIVYVTLILSVPVLVDERKGIIASMKRSRDLTEGSRGRIFLLVLILFLGIAGIATAVRMLTAMAGPHLWWAMIGARAITAAMNGLLSAAMLSSLYVEVRTVKEGATTESLAVIFA